MGSIQSDEQFEHYITLNPLDYIPPLNYVRLIFPLPLKPDVKESLVFRKLHEALHRTFTQEPWASGKVFRQASDTPGWRPGQLEIRHDAYSMNRPWPVQLRFKKLDTEWTYAKLMELGFPGDAFPEESLLDAPMIGDVDGAGADVLLAQANFLPGGLLLGMTACHAATDGAGMFSLTKLWGKNFRELHVRDGERICVPSTFSAASRDRTIIERLWKKRSQEWILHRDQERAGDRWLQGLVCLELDSDLPPKATTAAEDGLGSTEVIQGEGLSRPNQARIMLNRVMTLSSSCLAMLRKDCADSTAVSSPSLSTSDAIQALLWRCVMKARAASSADRGIKLDDMSVFETPVDIRHYFAPDLPSDYLGNAWVLNTARVPLNKLIDPSTSIGHVATAIRKGAARLKQDANALHEAYGLLRSTSDLTRVQGRFVERTDSADFLVSNLIFFPLGDLNFGRQCFDNDGRPETLRVLHSHYAPYVRLAHVLPRNAKGDVELSVNLFADEMAYLDADTEFTHYVDTQCAMD